MSRRSRTALIVVAGLAVVLVLSARAIAGFYTDYLWFDSLDFGAVWQRVLLTKIGLGAAFTVVFFVLMYVNLAIAARIAPTGPRGPEDELLGRYREFVDEHARLVRSLVSGGFALIAGVGASGQWNNWLLFRNGGSFGEADPLHGRDLGFYVFKLPFLSYLLSWLFASAIVVLLVTLVAHYLYGGIRFQVPVERVLPQVKAHLSVLLAVIALLKAGDYLLQRFQLLWSERGAVRGATYTDVNAQLPAINLLILISILSAVLFLVNIRQKGWTLPIVALGLWALVAIVAGALYPWFIQSFQVQRKESAREARYISRNIEATRAALGLSEVEELNFDYKPLPSDAAVNADLDTVENIRLLDPSVVSRTFRTVESQLNYYQFTDMDVDRYDLSGDGKETQVILAARGLDPDNLPQQTWEAQHLIFTHGYGLALAPANEVTEKGRPNFVVGNVPIQIDSSVAAALPIERPEIYFGEEIDGADGNGYAIVKTTREEQSGQTTTTYEGDGGVPFNGFLRRAAFFLRFGHLETLTSEFVTNDSRILYNRDVGTRVQEVAPFLTLDSDPYPVLIDGQVKFIVDAYTTTSAYPYAEEAITNQLEVESGLRGESFNYLRNSVKAVVDAYDGSVQLYMTDELYGERDPIIRAYDKAFPGLFQELDEMPTVIREHLRYPEDLFRLQTTMWGRYHIENSDEFYDQSDRWDVAQDPGTEISGSTATAEAGGIRPRIDPYYQIMKLPGDDEAGFLMFRPFVPTSNEDSKRQLTAFMVAKSDPDNYGELSVFVMTKDNGTERNRNVDGPLIVNDNILSDTNTKVSEQISLLEGGGSTVDFGNMLIVPLDQGLLYVRPIYVRAAQENSVPELRRVVVAMGDRVEVGDTLAEALLGLFPQAQIDGEPPTGDDPTSDDPGAEPVQESAGDLIADALAKFEDADEALREGGADGLASYERLIEEAEALVRQAESQLGLLAPAADAEATEASDDPAEPEDEGAEAAPQSVTTTTGRA